MAKLLNASAAGRQRGDVLLLVLVCLVVCMLGFIYASRKTIIDTQVTGNLLVKQKEAQSADIALRALETQILAVYNGQALELSAVAQPWWRDVPAGTAAPNAAYWANCLGNGNAASRCGQIAVLFNGQPLPYQVLAVVQPTGRTDATSCSLAQYQAVFYDIHLYVSETSGASGAATETVYRLCSYS